MRVLPFQRLLAALPVVGVARALSPRMCVETELTDGWFQVRAEIPGIDPTTDVDITSNGGELVIRARRRRRTEARRSEVRYGSFVRSVALPESANPVDITTNYEHGILNIWVPLSGSEPAIRRSVAVPVTY